MSLYQNSKIGGIKFKDNIYKIGLYADDTFLLLDGKEDSIRESFKTFNAFGKLSGLKINADKTQIA